MTNPEGSDEINHFWDIFESLKLLCLSTGSFILFANTTPESILSIYKAANNADNTSKCLKSEVEVLTQTRKIMFLSISLNKGCVWRG